MSDTGWLLVALARRRSDGDRMDQARGLDPPTAPAEVLIDGPRIMALRIEDYALERMVSDYEAMFERLLTRRHTS